MTIVDATNAIADLLRRERVLSQDVIDIADAILVQVWNIKNPHIREQIIQTAAMDVGLLHSD